MVICHCLAVNDKAIAALTADEAVSVDDVMELCGAGGECGGCRDAIAAVLAGVRSQSVELVGRGLVSTS